MTCLQITDVIYYTKCNDKKINYYVNLSSGVFYHIDMIIKTLSVSEKSFSEFFYDYDFIPLPVIDMSKIIKDFILSLNNKNIYNKLSSINDSEKLWIEFDKMFPAGFERRLWNEFFYGQILDTVKQWSKTYQVVLKEKLGDS